MNPKHFAGLDGLRFISIAFVVLHHLFTFKTNFGFTGYDYPVLWLIGFYGIQFFFMGSGFLITYLLYYEYQSYGRISLKNFFLRRILRIWPAYYLLIILFLLAFKQPFFRLPGITDSYLASNYERSNSLYLFFLPHLQPFTFPTAPYVHHTYTIGIEEQFYIIWGLLFYFFRKYMHRIFMALLFVVPLLNVAHEIVYTYLQQHRGAPRVFPFFNSAVTYIQYSRFSTFSIGSLFGYAYLHKKKWIYWFKSRPLQVFVYAVLFFSIFFRVELPFVQYEYISFLMACVMLIATFKKESMINFSAGWISYLGKISYGIYLYHIFAIVLACKLVKLFTNNENSLLVTLALCVLTLGMSVLFGEVSYRYFESYFLRLKEKFRQFAKNRNQSQMMRKDGIVHEK